MMGVEHLICEFNNFIELMQFFEACCIQLLGMSKTAVVVVMFLK